MIIVEAAKNPLQIARSKAVSDPLKNIMKDAVKKKLDKKEIISLKDFDKVFGTPELEMSEKDNEPKKGTDAYYIKHGLPFKELDPYD